MATRFDEWQTHVVGSPRMRYVEKLLGLLPSRPDSEAQLDLARQRIPTATFIRADLAELEFGTASFDGIVALYVLFHRRVPRSAHSATRIPTPIDSSSAMPA